MNKIKTLKLIAIVFFGLLMAPATFSQNMMQNQATPEMERAAVDEVQMWEEELSLTAKQMALMEKKVVEFIIKRQRVMNENIPEEQRLERLTDLKILETREMRDILTKPQYDRYLLLMSREAAGLDEQN